MVVRDYHVVAWGACRAHYKFFYVHLAGIYIALSDFASVQKSALRIDYDHIHRLLAFVAKERGKIIDGVFGII